MFWQQHLRPNSISGRKKKNIHFAFIRKSMFGQNRVIVMTTGRASLSDRCQEAVAQADLCHQSNRAAPRLALTPLCSNVIGWDWIVIDLDRPVIGPGSTVTHEVSQRESPLKRLHELCETCHSEPMFHSTAVKYLRRFLIPALRLDGRLWDRSSCKNSIHKKMETTQTY